MFLNFSSKTSTKITSVMFMSSAAVLGAGLLVILAHLFGEVNFPFILKRRFRALKVFYYS